MHGDSPHHGEPLRVVVAGGGIAGLETMVALRGLVGHRVALTLVEPGDELTIRALEVFEPLGSDIRASVPYPTVVELGPGARLMSDRVVHLPLLAGPNTPGMVCDPDGFILVDEAFRARDADGVFAVGDGAAGVHKQGGLAAQQAEAVAKVIARAAGSERVPRPTGP